MGVSSLSEDLVFTIIILQQFQTYINLGNKYVTNCHLIIETFKPMANLISKLYIPKQKYEIVLILVCFLPRFRLAVSM